MNTRPIKLLLLTFFLFGTGQLAWAAPNIISNNLTGSGSFTPGSTITFSADTRNSGTAMDTTNSYLLKQNYHGGPTSAVSDAVQHGNYLYVLNSGSGQLGMRIYNISNIENPSYIKDVQVLTPKSGWENSASAHAIAKSGNYLYIGGDYVRDDDHLAVFNISDPLNPSFVSSVDTDNGWGFSTDECEVTEIDDIEIVGNTLFINSLGSVKGDGLTKNFCSFNISNPANITPLGFLDTGGDSEGGIEISGNYAYMMHRPGTVSTFNGVLAINISNPSNITLADSIAIPFEVGLTSHQLEIQGQYLYAGTRKSGANDDPPGYKDFYVINISNPNSLSIVTDFEAQNSSTRGFFANYPLLYFSTGSLVTVDISNPSNPIMKRPTVQIADLVGPSYSARPGRLLFFPTTIYAAKASDFYTYRPYMKSRFCINSTDCMNAPSNANASGQIAEFEIDLLTGNQSVTRSINWTATLGTHTITYCSDVRKGVFFSGLYAGQYFDGVSESNENDNCTSYTFTVSNPPVNGSCGTANGGTYSSQPSSNLCSAGTVSWTDTVGSDGTYNWSCNGSNGGTNASCSATRPAPTASITAPDCVIAAGASSCSVSVSWTSSNTFGPRSVRQNGTQFSTSLGSAGLVRTLSYGSHSFTFFDNGVQIASDNATASCAAGSSWNGSICLGTPPAPTGLTATPGACGATNINVTWNSVSGASGYDLQINGGAWFNVGNVTSYSHTGLAAGSSHNYRVRAWNTSGAGTASGLVSATAPSPCPINASCGTRNTNYPYTTTAWPAGSTYCAAGTQSASPAFPGYSSSVIWQCYGQNGGTDSPQCVASRDAAPGCGSSAGGTYTTQPTSNLCTAGGVAWTDPSGNDGTFNWSCSAASCTANHQPDAPTSFSVTQGVCDSDALYLDWNDVTGAGSYSVYLSNGTWVANTLGSDLTTFTGTPGQTYTFYVRANSPIGVQSANSATFSGTVPASCPVITDGQCGTNARNYSLTDTAWPGSNFCAIGNLNPASPTFPVEGGATNWLCESPDTGIDRACQATRDGVVPPTLSLGATPGRLVRAGEIVAVNWTVDNTGTVDTQCTLVGPGVSESFTVTAGSNNSGSANTPPVQGVYSYTLTCSIVGNDYTATIRIESLGGYEEI